jgi:hypothetical protein
VLEGHQLSSLAAAIRSEDSQLIEIQGDGEVVEDTLGEWHAEEHLGRILVDISKELQSVGVGGVDAENSASLQDDLVRAEVVALQEGQLVLMGEVQRPREVLLQAEVKCLDALRGRVGAGIASNQQLGASEAGLAVEDGVITDGDFGGDGINVELGKGLVF